MKKHKKNKNTQVNKPKGNIPVVQAIKCVRGMVLPLTECQACEHHNNMSCALMDKKDKIQILPMMHPMQFNRTMFQQLSDGVREESINYYFKTDVLNDVNRIAGYPNYHIYKHKYIQGAFAVEKPNGSGASYPFNMFNIMLFLRQTNNIQNCDLKLDDKMYTVCQPFSEPGEWNVAMYLYNTYALEGFADVKILGIGYKVLFKPVDNYQFDYLVAVNNDKAIIGKVVR